MDSDSDFGEGDDRGMEAADMRKMADKLGKDGFRIGKAQEEEKQMQIGFDQGFDHGLQLGKVCGAIYAKVICAVDNTEMALNLSQLEVILMDTIPGDLEVCERSIRDLEQLLVKFKCDATEELKSLGELLES
uniref:Essential protein Yae1 N-terminal domain-containing protein n=1 Tax=Spumella elongata TaxID=89044 RepID=A0A7S3M619_9STRA|mmetsp:Transcript_34780/g.59942  ORF Transcript_34780/g.59942 Transcript_34780/m.59942 type:complete len:132 (+) Transcript_34780:63-458(+)